MSIGAYVCVFVRTCAFVRAHARTRAWCACACAIVKRLPKIRIIRTEITGMIADRLSVSLLNQHLCF